MVAPPAVPQRTMTVILNVTLPVFAIIALGWTMGRLGVLGDAATEALNKFVYWVALPPALFLATARNPIAEFVNVPFLGAFLGSMLAVFALGALLGRLLHRSPPEVMVMQALNACFSNTGYMGIPLFIAAFGPQGVAPAALATVVMSAVMVGLAVVALELAGASGKGVAAALGDVVRALGAIRWWWRRWRAWRCRPSGPPCPARSSPSARSRAPPRVRARSSPSASSSPDGR